VSDQTSTRVFDLEKPIGTAGVVDTSPGSQWNAPNRRLEEVVTDSYKPPPSPKGLGTAGRTLWRAVVGQFVLEDFELTQLHQAARLADLCDALQGELDITGAVIESPQGWPCAPAAIELRQAAQALSRILAALKIPAGLEDDQAGRKPGGQSGFRGPQALRLAKGGRG
jgi:hypothetical protein